MEQAAGLGLNVFGVLSPKPYLHKAEGGLKKLLHESTAMLMVGSGGRRYWEAFQQALAQQKSPLQTSADPLDDWFDEKAVELSPALDSLGVLGWKSSAVREKEPLPFQRLAVDCGMAVPSRLGVLLHPEFGPWLGLRLVYFLQEEVSLPAAERASLCAGCTAPCQTACHGGAVGVEGEFDWVRCSVAHRLKPVCRNSCDARLACPVGAGHRPLAETLAYHMTGDKKLLFPS